MKRVIMLLEYHTIAARGCVYNLHVLPIVRLRPADAFEAALTVPDLLNTLFPPYYDLLSFVSTLSNDVDRIPTRRYSDIHIFDILNTSFNVHISNFVTFMFLYFEIISTVTIVL